MKNPKLLIILFLNTLLLIAAIWLKPRFQTNDDIGMIYAYSGTAIFDTPTSVTAFSTKTFGVLMVFLYKVSPLGFEVYTIVFFLLIYCSLIFIHKKIIENLNYKEPFFWLITIPLLIFISLNFYLELQFTMVSGLLCLASFLLILNQPQRREMIMALVMFVIACLIRPSVVPILFSFFFILYFSFTFIFPQLVDSRRDILKRYGLLLLILGAVFLIDKGMHDENEKHFIEFNAYRASIVDYNIDKTAKHILPSNWDKEELSLFRNWFYNDTILFSINRDYANTGSAGKSSYLDKINVDILSVKVILQQFKDPLIRCILILALVPILFVKEWKSSFLSLAVVLITYTVFHNLLTIFFKTPPFRVSFVLFTSGILLHLYLATRLTGNETLKKARLLISCLFLLYGFLITKISLLYRHNDILKTRCTENYDKSLMYIRWAGYPFELVDPFGVSKGLHNIKIISMGAFSVHPAVNNSFGSFKYGNLTGDIIGKDNLVSFMMPEDKTIWEEFSTAYIAFIQKHYKRNVFFEKVGNARHCYGFTEFKLKEKVNDAEMD